VKINQWRYSGDNWINHDKKIKEYWEKVVKEDDLVLLLGDFSWAMYLEETYKDFEYLNNLSRKKTFNKRKP
jgi:predicted phosphohydrolase